MSRFNRVAALLEGCPDPGGVLYPQYAPKVCRSGVPVPRRVPVPKVTQLVLPASGVTVRQLAELLGLRVFEVMHEFIALNLFFPHDALLDHTALCRCCTRLGVSVVPAA